MRFGVRPIVFVAESDIERQVGSHSPIILHKGVVGVRAKIVRVCARLQAGLLWQSQQEVREIVSCVRQGLRRPSRIVPGGESGENKRTVRISRRTETLQDAPVVAAKSPVVLPAIPHNRIGNRKRLVEFAARHRIIQTAETVKADPRQPEIERVGRNSGDPRVPCHVNNSGIEIRRRNVIVVVREAQIVRDFSAAQRPASGCVESLCVAAAVERRKRPNRGGIRTSPVQPEIKVVLIAASVSAASAASSARAELPCYHPSYGSAGYLQHLCYSRRTSQYESSAPKLSSRYSATENIASRLLAAELMSAGSIVFITPLN